MVVKVAVVLDSVVMDTVVMVGASCYRCACKKFTLTPQPNNPDLQYQSMKIQLLTRCLCQEVLYAFTLKAFKATF